MQKTDITRDNHQKVKRSTQKDKWTVSKTGRQKVGQTEGWTDRRTDRRTDRDISTN